MLWHSKLQIIFPSKHSRYGRKCSLASTQESDIKLEFTDIQKQFKENIMKYFFHFFFHFLKFITSHIGFSFYKNIMKQWVQDIFCKDKQIYMMSYHASVCCFRMKADFTLAEGIVEPMHSRYNQDKKFN